MNRVAISLTAALMLGGASVAFAAGADKSSADQSSTSGAAAGQSSTSGMSAGSSSTPGSAAGTTSGSSGMSSSGSSATTPGAAAGTAATMTEADVEEKLTDEGYTQVSDIQKVGDKFEAKAMKDGKAVEVEIDPATGMVTDKSS